MNPDASSPAKQRPLIKRALPYLVIAAIVINTGLILIPVDFVLILINSVSNLLGIDANISPGRAYYTAGSFRRYANLALLVVFFIIFLRGLQETKTTDGQS